MQILPFWSFYLLSLVNLNHLTSIATLICLASSVHCPAQKSKLNFDKEFKSSKNREKN